MPRKELASAAAFEARRTMIPAPGAEAVFEAIVVGEETINKASRVHLLAVKTERQGLEERLGPFKRLGLIPRVITTTPFTLLHALTEEELRQANLAVIHFGATTLDLVISSKGRPRFFRSVTFGCREMLLELSTGLGLSEEDAERLLAAPDAPGSAAAERATSPRETAQRLQPYLERLVNEIRRSLAFYTEESGQRVEQLLLSGGGMLIPRVTEHLNRSLGGALTLLDPFRHARLNKGALENPVPHAPLYASAYGLAHILQEPSRANATINFLPLELKQRQRRILQAALSLQIGLGLITGAVIGWLNAEHHADSLRASIAAKRAATQTLQPYLSRQQEVETQRRDVQERLSALAELRASHPDAPAILHDVARRIPQTILLTTLTLQSRQPAAQSSGPRAGASSPIDEELTSRQTPRTPQRRSSPPTAPREARETAVWELTLEGDVTDRYEGALRRAEELRTNLSQCPSLRDVSLSFPPLETLQPRSDSGGQIELTQPDTFSFHLTATVK